MAHDFFKKSHKQHIIDNVLHNEVIKKTLIGRDRSAFQRLVDFKLNHDSSIDWPATISAIVDDLPQDDDFNITDIIPDYHKLTATIQPSTGNRIDFQLEVELGGFRPTTERGMNFTFEHGNVSLDVMASSMIIVLNNGGRYEIDLRTNNTDHADGDEYIAQSILGMSSKGQYSAQFNDPVVQLATFMGLVSEMQALDAHQDQDVAHLEKIQDKWFLIPGRGAFV